MRPVERALNRLAKWRAAFAGWQLGTRMRGDPEAEAVRDHREATLLHRVELSAVTKLLVDKGVFTIEEFEQQMIIECGAMHTMLEKKFPGFKANDDGMTLTPPDAVNTMRGWPP